MDLNVYPENFREFIQNIIKAGLVTETELQELFELHKINKELRISTYEMLMDEGVEIINDEEVDDKNSEGDDENGLMEKEDREEDEEEEEDDEGKNLYGDKSIHNKSLGNAIKIYLKKISTIGLLSKEQEVEYSKQIEEAKNSVLHFVSCAPVFIKVIEQWKEGLLAKTLLLRDFLNASDVPDNLPDKEIKIAPPILLDNEKTNSKRNNKKLRLKKQTSNLKNIMKSIQDGGEKVSLEQDDIHEEINFDEVDNDDENEYKNDDHLMKDTLFLLDNLIILFKEIKEKYDKFCGDDFKDETYVKFLQSVGKKAKKIFSVLEYLKLASIYIEIFVQNIKELNQQIMKYEEKVRAILCKYNKKTEEVVGVMIKLSINNIQNIIKTLNINLNTYDEEQIKNIQKEVDEIRNSYCIPIHKLKVKINEITRLQTIGNNAAREIVRGNLRLVVSLARRYREGGLSLEDLIQVGNAGLMRAVEKFSYRKGCKFSTYAHWWIRQAITRFVSDRQAVIRMPIHMGDFVNKIKKAVKHLHGVLERMPTVQEIADYTQESVDKIRKSAMWCRKVTNMSEMRALLHDDDKDEIDENIEEKNVNSFESKYDNFLLSKEINKGLKYLNPREELVVSRRFLKNDVFLKKNISGLTKDNITIAIDIINENQDLLNKCGRNYVIENTVPIDLFDDIYQIIESKAADMSYDNKKIISLIILNHRYLRYNLQEREKNETVALEKLGDFYDVSRERIRQVQDKAIRAVNFNQKYRLSNFLYNKT